MGSSITGLRICRSFLLLGVRTQVNHLMRPWGHHLVLRPPLLTVFDGFEMYGMLFMQPYPRPFCVGFEGRQVFPMGREAADLPSLPPDKENMGMSCQKCMMTISLPWGFTQNLLAMRSSCHGLLSSW